MERVGACTADQDVVAAAAVEIIVTVAAVKRVFITWSFGRLV
jgi:hypothetical protein